MTEFKQNMTLHFNGGSDFSSLHYEVTADGKPTDITRFTKTNGRPQYRKTEDKLICGDDVFDVLATKGVGIKDWLESHIKQEKSA